jgi:hypothetical protein
MRKLLFVLFLMAVVVVAIGFYRGWFGVSTSSEPQTDKKTYEFNVDPAKVQADIEAAKKKVIGAVEQATDKTEGKQGDAKK